MPRFLVVGDIHSNFAALQHILMDARDRADVHAVLLVGDLTGCLPPRRPVHPADCEDFEREMGYIGHQLHTILPGRPVYYVPGNHDMPTAKLPGNIDGRIVDVEGVKIAGVGGGATTDFGFPYDLDVAGKTEQLNRMYPDGFPEGIILAHTPPYKACDKTKRGELVGCTVLAERAANHTGLILCGHIHEAVGFAEMSSRCLVINAGSLGEPYPWKGYVLLDWDGTKAEVSFCLPGVESIRGSHQWSPRVGV